MVCPRERSSPRENWTLLPRGMHTVVREVCHSDSETAEEKDTCSQQDGGACTMGPSRDPFHL